MLHFVTVFVPVTKNKGINKMETNNKYAQLRGYYAIIATAADCSREYVKSVLTGRREGKTGRAKKAILVRRKADELVNFLSRTN